MSNIDLDTKSSSKKDENTLHILWSLFFAFFKIGLFTFGGGYAMIPIIQREIAENKKWITNEDILDIIAIAESTPGPIALNMATFVGYKVSKVKGAFCATFGVVLPSFSIIILISYILEIFENLKAVKYAFFGIRAGVLAMLIGALVKMYKSCPKGKLSYFIFAFSFILVTFTKVHILIVIASCGFFGWLYSYLTQRKETK